MPLSMKLKDLRDWIDGLTQDIEFSYKDVCGSICLLSREHIELCYGDNYATAHSVNGALSIPFIDGKSLTELCEAIEI